MKFLSDNPLYEAFGQRAILRSPAGGADFGECFATIKRIGSGSIDDWYKEWTLTADRIASIGDSCLAEGHQVSAREAYLRASTYYQASYFPLFGKPIDPRMVEAFHKETDVFHRAAALFNLPIEILEIPFEGSTIPAYFIKAESGVNPRPTMIYVNGYDSNIQEMYFYHALGATKRGYHCLLFDGPGQGRNLIRDNIPIRPDWENVVRPVIDYALTRSEIDPNKIVLSGWNFGGFLAARASAFEHRIAALVVDPGQWDLRNSMFKHTSLSEEERARFPNLDPKIFQQLEEDIRNKADPLTRWRIIQRGFWVHDVETLYDLFRSLFDFEISAEVKQISCPTIISFPEGDPIATQAPLLYEALEVQKKLMKFSLEEGSGGHCETMARALYHQRIFDCLDEWLQSE